MIVGYFLLLFLFSCVMNISNTAAMPSAPHLYHVGKHIIDLDTIHRQIVSYWSSHNNYISFRSYKK